RVVIERRAVEELETLTIDEHARPVGPVEGVIPVPGRRLPGERVAQPGTATGLDRDPETPVRNAVFGGHFPDELPRVLTDLEHGSLTGGISDQKSPILSRSRPWC